jgi:hypothetical protein
MFRYDRISITVPAGDLAQEVWSFWFDDRDTLVLDAYKFQERPSKRHKWVTQAIWTRIDNRRNSTIKNPSVPECIQAQAKADFLAQFESILKVEA